MANDAKVIDQMFGNRRAALMKRLTAPQGKKLKLDPESATEIRQEINALLMIISDLGPEYQLQKSLADHYNIVPR